MGVLAQAQFSPASDSELGIATGQTRPLPHNALNGV